MPKGVGLVHRHSSLGHDALFAVHRVEAAERRDVLAVGARVGERLLLLAQLLEQPQVLGEGELVLRCISRLGSQTWIVFWFEREIMYFLLAPSEEMLDFVIDNTGLPGPMEGSMHSA